MSLGRNLLPDLKFLIGCLLRPFAKKGIYIGYVGYGNLGDEALRDAIFLLFRSEFLFAESRGVLIRFFERIGLVRFSMIMLGGGTLVLMSQDILETLKNSPAPLKVVFGTGVADFSFWEMIPNQYGSKAQWVALLQQIDHLSVRGPVSKKILVDYGVQRDFKAIGDPVLYFTRPISGPKRKQKILGVNIGTAQNIYHKDMLWGRNENLFVETFAQFLQEMIKEHWAVEILPVDSNDLKVIHEVIHKSDTNEKISIFPDFHNVKLTLDRLETYDVFLGEKLHSVILAYCANTPAVMVEYQPKCFDFMASIQMESFNMRTSEFTVELAKKKVYELYDNVESFRKTTNTRCLSYKDTLVSEARRVMES